MATTLTNEDIQAIIEAIKADSQDVTQLTEATSLEGLSSLPTLNSSGELVSAPLELLTQLPPDADVAIADAKLWWLNRIWYYLVEGPMSVRSIKIGALLTEDNPSFTCPVTGKTFTYTAEKPYILNGLALNPQQAAQIVLTAVHRGKCLGLTNLPIDGTEAKTIMDVSGVIPLREAYFTDVWWGSPTTSSWIVSDGRSAGTDPGHVANANVQEMRFVNATSGQFSISNCAKLVTCLFCRVTQPTVNLSGAPLLSTESIYSCLDAIVAYRNSQATTVKLHADALQRFIDNAPGDEIGYYLDEHNITITA